MNTIGLYIHIPFCKSKCAYCNFTSFKCLSRIDEYLECLEMEMRRVLNKGIIIDTLYIGGGTPSILSAEKIARIVSVVKECATFKAREVTIECNPESVDEEKIAKYHDIGINRISMGVQSINDRVLKAIGRIHTSEMAIEKARLIKKYGFNLSVDMILGLPYSSTQDIAKFIDTFSVVGVNHISSYSLSVEEGTPISRMVRDGSIIVPSEDETIDQYDTAYDMLTRLGYRRYEVSNYARIGFESQHNLKYWHMDEYIGVGIASHSFLDGRRYYNTSNLDEYIRLIKSGKLPSTLDETLTLRDRVEETIMLGLRTEKGVNIARLDELIGGSFLDIDKKNITRVRNYINISDNYLSIKPEYMNVMNTIIVDLIS